MVRADTVAGLFVGSTSPAFLAVLAVHVPAALGCVATGAGAALARKGGRWHTRLGRLYWRGLFLVAGTALLLALLRWPHDLQLVALGVVALGAATTGVLLRRRRRGHTGHIAAMATSYAVMLTAFYVDNGPHLPLWRLLPWWAFWLLPGVVATPLTIRAALRARGRRGRWPASALG